MYLADGWRDYALLDAGNGMKRERWGDVTLLRPDPQAVWPMKEQQDSSCRQPSTTSPPRGLGRSATTRGIPAVAAARMV